MEKKITLYKVLQKTNLFNDIYKIHLRDLLKQLKKRIKENDEIKKESKELGY